MPDLDFNNLLKQAMGLDAASIGSASIERAVDERLLACRLNNPQAYWEYVRGSASELQELIEAVVVPETWFFRDREAFSALSRMVFEEWLPAHAQATLRVLSLPCSTGEEPYSIAMALLDAGLPADRFRIDAVDISEHALELARRAVYGRNSFRGKELDFRDRYFAPSIQGHQLSDVICQCVHFMQGNMFADGFLPGEGIYDAVFCRNVLIYFDRPTQDRAIKLLERLLTAAGVLFVAPSETGLLFSHGFVSTKVPLAFAFRKAGPVMAAPMPAHMPPLHQPAHTRARPSHTLASKRPAHSQLPKPAAAAMLTPTNKAPVNGLEAASLLADQGLLVDAAKSCEEYLKNHGPSAQAFYLLGLVRDTSGNSPEAAEYYRKALYLDPHHQETLLHLAFLQEKQGNPSGARMLHSRLQRLAHKSEK